MTNMSRREKGVAPESIELSQRVQKEVSCKQGQAITAIRDG